MAKAHAMTHSEMDRAKKKLFYFFFELFDWFPRIEYRSYLTKTDLQFSVANGTTNRVRCIAVDFTDPVTFKMQISSEYFLSHIFSQSKAPNSNVLYGTQPALHTHWSKSASFRQLPSESFLSVNVPYVKENGMGMYLLEDEDMDRFASSDRLQISFTLVKPFPSKCTIYILRR